MGDYDVVEAAAFDSFVDSLLAPIAVYFNFNKCKSLKK